MHAFFIKDKIYILPHHEQSFDFLQLSLYAIGKLFVQSQPDKRVDDQSKNTDIVKQNHIDSKLFAILVGHAIVVDGSTDIKWTGHQ